MLPRRRKEIEEGEKIIIKQKDRITGKTRNKLSLNKTKVTPRELDEIFLEGLE